MRKIHKIINIAIIYIIIGVFFVQGVVYSSPNGNLRPEMGFSDDRKDETKNRLDILETKSVEEDDSVTAERLTVNDQVLLKLQALVNKCTLKITKNRVYTKDHDGAPYKKLSWFDARKFKSLMNLIDTEVIIEKGQDVERVLGPVIAKRGRRVLASGHTITRRDFVKTAAGVVAILGFPSLAKAQKAPIKKEMRETSYDFSPAQVVASIGGPGFSDTRIIESSRTKTVHVIMDLEEPLAHKMIQWKWAKSGDSWTAARWDNGSETIDLSSNREDMVLRFIVFGTPHATYKIRLEDDSGQKVEFTSTENLTTQEGKQYSLMRLDELARRNSSFNWKAVKPIKFVSASPTNAILTIKNIEILNVKNVRDRGIGIGMFLSKEGIDGNNFPALGGYTGYTGDRPPASVLSFSGLLERDVDQLTTLWNSLPPGVVPHEILEPWLPAEQLGKLSKAMFEQELTAARQEAETLKARIMAGDKSENYKTSGWNNVLKRLSAGECDDIFIKRARAAAKYGKTVILRMLHEPTGQWYPWSFSNQPEADDYIAAWRHIVKIYRDNGANNVVFAFSPHNYEPEALQQTRKYQLIDYVLYHLQEDINLIGIDAYSYPPSGGYMNGLATGLLDLAVKYQIPIMMGETSSAMSEEDKRNFWNYLAVDSKNGMFPFVGIGVFSIAKDENGWKDFHPPADIMQQWERDSFFAPNPFKELKGGKRNRIEGLAEPGLPWLGNSRLIADWIYSGGNEQQFTLLPNGMEEWAWKKVSGGWYGWGAGIDIKDRAFLNNSTISNFEFVMPLEILERDFNLILEDNQGQPTGKEIRLTRDVLLKYIVDGRLIIPLTQVIQYGIGDKDSFNWGDIRQVKIGAISDGGKALFGRAAIKKIDDTVVIDNLQPQQKVAVESVELYQNYPNPFGRDGTTIAYKINRPSNNVRIKIFDGIGGLVRDLGKVDGSIGPHIIKWDARDKSGRFIPSGTYLIRITIEGEPEKTIKSIKLGIISAIGLSGGPHSKSTIPPEEIISQIKEVRERKIRLRVGKEINEDFTVMQWRKAMDWIFEKDRGLKGAVESYLESQPHPISRFKNPFIFSNDLIIEWGRDFSREAKYIYKHHLIKDLRRQIVKAQLEELRLECALLRRLIMEIGFKNKEFCIFDLAQGANPLSCLISDKVVGVNIISAYKGVMNEFIEQFGEGLGLTIEDVDRKLYPLETDITAPESLKQSFIAQLDKEKKLLRLPKVVLLNSIGEQNIYTPSWLEGMDSFIGTGDMIIFSGHYTERLKQSFIDTGKYTRVLQDSLEIFNDKITERFFIYDKKGSFQYIYTLGPVEILIKKGENLHRKLETSTTSKRNLL